MIIIRKGNADIGKWWHGKTLCCPSCKETVRLESKDENDQRYITSGPDEFRMGCGNCRDVMILKKP